MGFDLNRSWHQSSPWAHPGLHAVHQMLADLDQDKASSFVLFLPCCNKNESVCVTCERVRISQQKGEKSNLSASLHIQIMAYPASGKE
jgi:hypothetical protein